MDKTFKTMPSPKKLDNTMAKVASRSIFELFEIISIKKNDIAPAKAAPNKSMIGDFSIDSIKAMTMPG